MVRPAILSVLLLVLVGVCPPPPTLAADEKPAPAGDLTKKFVIVNRKVGADFQSELVKRVEFRRLGNREFLVGEYCVNVEAGVGKEWEGVQLWVPVDGIQGMMVFTDEAKAFSTIKENAVPKDKQ